MFKKEDEDTTPPGEDFEPFTVIALVEARRQCVHSDDTWARFTAKVGLGFVSLLQDSAEVLEDGFPAAGVLSPDGYDRLTAALRDMAFATTADRSCGSEPFRTSEPEHPRPIHAVGLMAREGDAVAIVRLFDFLNYRVTVPGIRLVRDIQLSLVARTT